MCRTLCMLKEYNKQAIKKDKGGPKRERFCHNSNMLHYTFHVSYLKGWIWVEDSSSEKNGRCSITLLKENGEAGKHTAEDDGQTVTLS